MSISRKNWSALSSLARQWTVEDEEEVEREKRRRVRGFSSTTDPNDDPSPDPGHPPTSGAAPRSAAETDPSSDRSQGLSNAEQLQLDFVEMLRVRDEKRRSRHVETLRRQRGGEQDGGEEDGPGGGGAPRLELLGDMEGDEEDQGRWEPAAPSPPGATHGPGVPPLSPRSITTASAIIAPTRAQSQQSENEHLPKKSPEPKPSSTPGRKFVSSVSISFDKGSSSSERSGPTSPMSPHFAAAPLSPREHWPSPCPSPSPGGAQSPTQNGHSPGSVNGAQASGTVNVEQTARPAFARQSSRTASFRMLRKKEEERLPQRSASVRMPNKNLEPTDQNQENDNASHFQRKQRVSSRTIQEKMERLAQAAQKSEMMRSPDVAQRTLFLLDEVSRKRGLFEKEAGAAGSPEVPRQESRSFTAGLSDRINRFVGKTGLLGSSRSPTDLRHVDITSKRTLFEGRAEESYAKPAPHGKVCK